MPHKAATTNSPFVSPSFISFIRRVLVGAAKALVVSLLLLIGTQQEAWAQPADASQVYCGPWEVEPWDNSGYEETTESSGEVGRHFRVETQYWNFRWCYSPEVSGGWYQDYAGYSLSAPDATLSTTPSADSVTVGEPVTFYLTLTNNEPYTHLSPVIAHLAFFYYSAPYEFVSASSSQGQCTFLTGGGVGPRGAVGCELGTVTPGASVYMDIVVVPQEPGSLRGHTTSRVGVQGRGPGVRTLATLTPYTEFSSVTVEPA